MRALSAALLALALLALAGCGHRGPLVPPEEARAAPPPAPSA